MDKNGSQFLKNGENIKKINPVIKKKLEIFKNILFNLFLLLNKKKKIKETIEFNQIYSDKLTCKIKHFLKNVESLINELKNGILAITINKAKKPDIAKEEKEKLIQFRDILYLLNIIFLLSILCSSFLYFF